MLVIAVSVHLGVESHADDMPIVPDGFAVDVVAKEPMVSNPCVMAFDRLGRLCVAQGQQWRAPTPETPGDRIDILIDTDGTSVTSQSAELQDEMKQATLKKFSLMMKNNLLFN